MQSNIYQVIHENHLDEILNDHSQNLIIIMYSSKTCNPCKIIKPKFTNLSKLHKDSFFIYIDITNFTRVSNKYFEGYNFTPTFFFYFGGKKIAIVEGAHEQSLTNTIILLKKKIDEKRKEMIEREKNVEKNKLDEISHIPIDALDDNNCSNSIDSTTESLKKKIDILNKLKLLMQSGIKLSKNFNLESNYDEMLFEFEFHTNLQFRQQILNEEIHKENHLKQINQQDQELNEKEVPSNINNTNKKQEQIRQLQELSLINQRIQMQNLYKLEQLKQIQKMKEQQEKNILHKDKKDN